MRSQVLFTCCLPNILKCTSCLPTVFCGCVCKHCFLARASLHAGNTASQCEPGCSVCFISWLNGSSSIKNAINHFWDNLWLRICEFPRAAYNPLIVNLLRINKYRWTSMLPGKMTVDYLASPGLGEHGFSLDCVWERELGYTSRTQLSPICVHKHFMIIFTDAPLGDSSKLCKETWQT